MNLPHRLAGKDGTRASAESPAGNIAPLANMATAAPV